MPDPVDRPEVSLFVVAYVRSACVCTFINNFVVHVLMYGWFDIGHLRRIHG